MLRVAVIGLGVISPIHIQFIRGREDLELSAGCDIVPERAAKLPAGVPFYEDYEKLLDEIKPDVAHCCLPHYLHEPFTEAAVSRGIRVFCEKPISSTYEGALSMTEMERTYGRMIGICLQNRLNPVNQKIVELSLGGFYGRVLGVKGRVDWFRPASYYQAEPWRGKLSESGSGCILNQSIHTLDMMTLLHPEPPVSVRGALLHLSGYPIEVEDSAAASLTYADGTIGYFTASVVNHSNEPVELTVLLEKGTLILRGNKLWLSQDGEETLLQEDERADGEKFYYGTSHNRCMNLFYEALKEGHGRCIRAADALPAMKIYEAIRRSSAEGSREILLSDI